jgi:hypothetical protein
VLPAPRAPRPAGPRRRARLALLAVLLAAAATASALDLSVLGIQHQGGDVWCMVRLDDLFPSRIEESLARGMPATLQLHAELWRKRSVWFDKLDDSFDAELRIQYEVWERAYRLERRDAPPERFATLDSLRAALHRPLAMRVGRRAKLSPGGRYYVAVTATLKPLSLKDAAEIEVWLSGEVEEKSHSGLGAIGELPSSVFDAVRNFAGFGDIHARATSETFIVPREPEEP